MSASNVASSSLNLFNFRRWPVPWRDRSEKFQRKSMSHGRVEKDSLGPFSRPCGIHFFLLQIIIPLPFQQAIAIFIGSAIIHLSLIIVRGNNNGYKTTFRAISYSYSGYLFGIIPFIG